MGKLWLGTERSQIQVVEEPLLEEPAPIIAATEHIAYVDRIIYVDKPVEVVVEKQVIVEVPVDRVVFVDKPFETIVERIVHVDRPVEKIVEITKELPPVFVDRIVPVKSIPEWVWGVMALEAAALIASVVL